MLLFEYIDLQHRPFDSPEEREQYEG